MSERIIADFGKFRVVGRPGENIFVQGWIGDRWKDLQSYNVISDDYAFTNAREDAERRQKQNDRPDPNGCDHLWATRDIDVNSGRPYCQQCGLDWQSVFKAERVPASYENT